MLPVCYVFYDKSEVGWGWMELLQIVVVTFYYFEFEMLEERERDWWLVVGGSKLVACPMYSHCIVAFIIIITGIMNESDTWWRRRYNR